MKEFVIGVIVSLLAGCAMLQERDTGLNLTVQYATSKVISRSDDVTADDVIDHVQKARTLMNDSASITAGAFGHGVREAIDWDRLEPPDRVLLEAVISEAEARIQERIGEGVLSESDRVAINTLLDWIEQAARANQ